MLGKLKNASVGELQAWMWGAGILGFGLGLLASSTFVAAAWWIVGAGAVIHGSAMYRIYGKK